MRQTIMLEGGPHDLEAVGAVSERRDHVVIGHTARYRRTDRADGFGRPIFEYVADDTESAVVAVTS
jgi:hypothetical protein